MLRVTKDLQSVLALALRGPSGGGGSGGTGETMAVGDSRQAAAAELLERKMEHLAQSLKAKTQNFKRQFQSVRAQIATRSSENALLEEKLRDLRQGVKQREHIRRIKATTSAPTKPQAPPAAAEGEKPQVGAGKAGRDEGEIRFKEVQQRTHLLELVKRHTKEIELLRKELDRLRQRTFPTFVHLYQSHPANPDASSGMA
mmetsp:Transcript_39392/g.112376  ORF Transcript_39392/g.112376 Transcript_39392/m.112376 type:complete len:200 (-) Transcript_39392:1110-1709(-)